MRSRISEALVLKTDEERMTWFNSLSEKEKGEVVKDAQKIADTFTNALRKSTENFTAMISELNFVINSMK